MQPLPRNFHNDERDRFWARKQQEHTMSKTITIPGFVWAQPAHAWEKGPAVVDGHTMSFYAFSDMEDHGLVKVTSAVLTFDMPEGWDPRAQQIDALRKEEEKARAAYQARVTEIQAQINNLLALEA